MTGRVYRRLLDARRDSPRLLWLIDPDKIDPDTPDPRWALADECGVAAILVGTSQGGNPHFNGAIAALRRHTLLPVVLFPGSAAQVSPHVDAVLFLTLLSGRNPDFLVGEQVKGTPLVRDYRIEPIPTGYILVNTGTHTSVARNSNTRPIPEADLTSICDHALCAQYMGQALVYLEAGSGAARPIGSSVIEMARQAISVPLLVGGGIRTPEACERVARAGADFVVVGTVLEQDRSSTLLRELSDATRGTAVRV